MFHAYCYLVLNPDPQIIFSTGFRLPEYTVLNAGSNLDPNAGLKAKQDEWTRSSFFCTWQDQDFCGEGDRWVRPAVKDRSS